jgi:hypothetical protein
MNQTTIPIPGFEEVRKRNPLLLGILGAPGAGKETTENYLQQFDLELAGQFGRQPSMCILVSSALIDKHKKANDHIGKMFVECDARKGQDTKRSGELMDSSPILHAFALGISQGSELGFTRFILDTPRAADQAEWVVKCGLTWRAFYLHLEENESLMRLKMRQAGGDMRDFGIEGKRWKKWTQEGLPSLKVFMKNGYKPDTRSIGGLQPASEKILALAKQAGFPAKEVAYIAECLAKPTHPVSRDIIERDELQAKVIAENGGIEAFQVQTKGKKSKASKRRLAVA